MAGPIGKATSSLLDLLFGKQRAVELGPPGQEATGLLEEHDSAEEKKREWELPNVSYDPNDPSDVRPIDSWDKID